MGYVIDKERVYKLDGATKKILKDYLEAGDVEGLIEFAEVIAMVASFYTWRKAEEHLEEVGEEAFFIGCNNCNRCMACTLLLALKECGDHYKLWKPITNKNKLKLKKLQASI